MYDLKMILNDGTELALDAFTLPMHAVMTCKGADDIAATMKLLTEDNLSSVEIRQGDVPVYKFADGRLDGQQSAVNGDGTLTVHYYMSGKQAEVVSDKTAEYVAAAKILLGEEE